MFKPRRSRKLLCILALGVALALAPTALAAPATPSTTAVAAALTPVVNAKLTAAHFTSYRFARAVCVREATPGRYLCTAAHLRPGGVQDGLSDVWEVIAVGARMRYAPSSACPLGPGKCVNTNLMPLTAG